MFKRWIQNQLESPSGCIERFVLPRFWNRRNKVLNDITLCALRLRPEDRVLEVGFGGGYLLQQMIREVTDGYVVGVDVSKLMVNRLQSRFQKQIQSDRMEVLRAPVEKLPFPSKSYGKVCSVNSVFYWNDVEKGLSEVYRVLQTEGQFVITFTSDSCLRNRFHMAELHLFSIGSMRQRLSETGFQKIWCETHQDKYRTFHCCVGFKVKD
ncbi:methyltransferase domain-containing protein [bacterium]|nr:methyltransferase domain-containing protein [bacterium]RQV97934.1 MAG: methyltransferase domain-containing protein [bacterium]